MDDKKFVLNYTPDLAPFKNEMGSESNPPGDSDEKTRLQEAGDKSEVTTQPGPSKPRATPTQDDSKPAIPAMAPKVFRKKNGRALSVVDKAAFAYLGEHRPVKGTSRRCAYCSTKAQPKRSQIICKKCKVAICLPCFGPFHRKN